MSIPMDLTQRCHQGYTSYQTEYNRVQQIISTAVSNVSRVDSNLGKYFLRIRHSNTFLSCPYNFFLQWWPSLILNNLNRNFVKDHSRTFQPSLLTAQWFQRRLFIFPTGCYLKISFTMTAILNFGLIT